MSFYSSVEPGSKSTVRYRSQQRKSCSSVVIWVTAPARLTFPSQAFGVEAAWRR